MIYFLVEASSLMDEEPVVRLFPTVSFCCLLMFVWFAVLVFLFHTYLLIMNRCRLVLYGVIFQRLKFHVVSRIRVMICGHGCG